VHAPGSPRLFSGWIVLAGAFLSFATAAGLMHSYAVFFVAFLGEFGWSRAETSVAYAVSQLISGVSAPLVGVLVDRLGPRILVLVGGSVLAVGLAANSYVSSLWQLEAYWSHLGSDHHRHGDRLCGRLLDERLDL